jgi:hypothetical protein
MIGRLRNGIFLLLCLVLGACGGNPSGEQKNGLQLSGAIVGLEGELVLGTGTGFSKHFYEGGIFDFSPLQFETGDVYNVSVVLQPPGQICDVKRGQGTFSTTDVSNIEITCRQNFGQYSLSGTVEYLISPITVTDGLGNAIEITSAGAFSFDPIRYEAGDFYTVVVIDSGPDQYCDVFSGFGIFSSRNIEDVFISCFTTLPRYQLTAEIYGLEGELTLAVNAGEYSKSFYGTSGVLSASIVYLPDNTSYNVTIISQPEAQNCALINGNGTISGSEAHVIVECSDLPYDVELKGSLSGSVGSVTLTDGLGGIVQVNGDGEFSFGIYPSGSQYVLTVVSQPEGQVCMATPSSGTLSKTTSNIRIFCRPDGIAVSGTATGIVGSVSLDDGNGNKATINKDGEFYFATSYESGAGYDISVESQPEGQICEVFYSTGNVGDNGVGDVQLVCRAEGTYLNPCGPPISQIDPARFILTQQIFNFGESLGEGGFSSFDSNLNGLPEILFGQGVGFGSPTKFSVIEYQPEEKTFASLCTSTEFEKFIIRVLKFENYRNRAASLIAFQDGEILLINHTSGNVIHSFNVGVRINDVAIGDADNDGIADIVVVAENTMSLYDADTFDLKQSAPFGGAAVTVGRFTDPQVNEVAINSGLVLRFTQSEYQVTWDNSGLGFGDRYITSGDVDGDGLDEIIAGDRWYAIRAFNADTRGILWDYSPRLDIGALRAYDTDGDGIAEVLYGDGQHGDTYVLDGTTALPIQSFRNLNSGVTDFLVEDLDGDGNLELIRGTGNGTTGEDYLDVIDLVTGETDWVNSAESGSFNAFAIGDLNGDSIADYVYASPSSDSLDGGVVTAVNGATGNILWTTLPESIQWSTQGIAALAVGDIDGDGVVDVLVGTDFRYDGRIYRLDGVTGALSEQVLDLESGSPVRQIVLSDIDGDGEVEIIAGAGVAHTGSSGSKVHIIDGVTFSLERSLPRLDSDFGDVTALEVTESGSRIAALRDKVYLLNPTVNSVVATEESFLSLAAIGDDLFAANESGELKAITADAGVEPRATLCNGSVRALTAVSDNELAFVCEQKLGLYLLDADEVVWQSEAVSSSLGGTDALVFGRVGDSETILAGGNSLYVFERPAQ